MMRRRESGFTLVEMLIATVLVAFLAVLMFGGLRLGSRVWDRSQQIYHTDQALRAAQRYLASALEQAYPARSGPRMAVEFQGTEDTLSWLTLANAADGNMLRVTLSLEPSGEAHNLVVSSKSELSLDTKAKSQTLLGDVTGAAFAYYGRRRGETKPHWSQDWNDQTRLPDLVRIRLSMRGAAWPDLIVAPRISADVGCTLDMISHDCAGR